MSGEEQQDTPRIRLTGRGAVVIMLAVFALGLLGASWLGWPVLAGASFAAGSAAAVFYVRPRDLLMVTVTPPLLWGIAMVGVKAGTATGNVALSTAEGAAVTLAGTAPWLFAGMVLTLVIAWSRGLRECVNELREDLWLAVRWPGPVAGPRSGAAGPRPGPATPYAPPRSPASPAALRPGPAAQDATSRPLATPADPGPDLAAGPDLATQDAPPSAS